MQQLSRQHEVLLRLFLDQERRSHAFDGDGETGCCPVAGGRLHHGSDDIGMRGGIARTEDLSISRWTTSTLLIGSLIVGPCLIIQLPTGGKSFLLMPTSLRWDVGGVAVKLFDSAASRLH